jgi:uncharacterized glyoxalase superfamily protein PhnB
MSETHLWKSPQIVPALAYDDVPKAVEWLTRVFGFRERTEARLTGVGWVLTWVEIGDGLIRLGTVGGHDLRSPKSIGGVSQSLRVYVDDVDQHFERAKAGGATIISELEDRFSGGRIYRAEDYEGHHWEFSQSGRELAAKDWKLPDGVNRNG